MSLLTASRDAESKDDLVCSLHRGVAFGRCIHDVLPVKAELYVSECCNHSFGAVQ